MRSDALPVAVLLLGSLLWGLSWWPLKYINAQGLAGPPLLLLAYGTAALATLPWLWRERAAWTGRRQLLLLYALLGGYANLAFASALIYGEVVRVMMLFYLGPVWGVLGGRLLLGEAVGPRRLIGVVLAVAGAWLILGVGALGLGAVTPTDLLALSAGLAFALNNIAFRATQNLPTGSKLVAMLAGCAAMAALLIPLQGHAPPALGTATSGLAAAFGLAWILGGTLATQWAVTHMEAGRASILLISELLVAVVSATLIGDERLSAVEWAGGAFILASALIETWRASPAPAPIPGAG